MDGALHGRAASGDAIARGTGLLATLLGAALIVSACGSSQTDCPGHGGTAARPAAGFAEVILTIPAGNRGGSLTGVCALTLPHGWTAEVWARVPSARLEAWTPAGDLLVSDPADGKVYELIPHAIRSQPPTERTLLSGLTNPQGLAFDRLHGQEVLYVAESDELDRYVWTDSGPAKSTVLLGHLPDTGPSGADVHRLKNVVVSPNHTVYLDIGSASNASVPTSAAGLPRASVISVQPNGTDARVFATGIRNGDGLAFAPDGSLWTAVNERDNIAYPFHRAYAGDADAFGQIIQAYVNDHPPDELVKLTPGRDVGWPYCNPDPDVDPGAATTAKRYANPPFDRDAQTNPTCARLDCASLAPIERGLPAHSAPLGFHFLEGSRLPTPWTGGAVVAVHGSWDRRPPRPPAVLWLPWEASTHTLGAPIALISGFQLASGDRWGRPVDVVPGPDGALYVSDDTAGAIYRIVP
jgi:glucose/arabinose dehydrogenase